MKICSICGSYILHAEEHKYWEYVCEYKPCYSERSAICMDCHDKYAGLQIANIHNKKYHTSVELVD